MITLAIDTSDRHFSLALLTDQQVVAKLDSREFHAIQTSSAPNSSLSTGSEKSVYPGVSVSLFPALKMLLKASGKTLPDVELIAIATGPGMFTGLRVGVVAAKTLAFAMGIPLIGVNTLAVIAARVTENVQRSGENNPMIYPILNAQRQQLFCGFYQHDNNAPGGVRELAANQILDRDVWMDGIKPGSVVTGSGLKPLIEQLNESRTAEQSSLVVAPESIWDCQAVGVGRLGGQCFRAGQCDDIWSLEPFYFRPSYAEEKTK